MLAFIKRLTPLGLVLCLAAPAAVLAQEPDQEDLAAQIEELKKGQEQIRRQLQQIQTLLQQQRQAPARPAGPDVAGKVFDLGDNPVKGATSAKLTLVEFTDYQ